MKKKQPQKNFQMQAASRENHAVMVGRRGGTMRTRSERRSANALRRELRGEGY